MIEKLIERVENKYHVKITICECDETCIKGQIEYDLAKIIKPFYLKFDEHDRLIEIVNRLDSMVVYNWFKILERKEVMNND